jgi:hypothetical protein
LIELSLEIAGLQADPELLEAVIESSDLLVGRTLKTTTQESAERCARLRTLCAGLVAIAVNYKGPLAGWNLKGRSKWYSDDTPTSWFPKDDSIVPVTFIAQATERLPTIGMIGLWPMFERPSIPDDSLFHLIAEFARSLASRTGELVRARVVPLPAFNPEEDRLYDFILESAISPLANTVLFTIQQANAHGPLYILSWDEEIEAIRNERNLISFLSTVALATRTRQAVERLLLIVPNEA